MPKSNFNERIKELKPIHFLVIFVFTVIFFGVLVGIYNYRQADLKTPVELIIATPFGEDHLYDSEVIAIEGRTDKSTPVLVGESKTISNDEGLFYAEVPLKVGENEVLIVAGEGSRRVTQEIILIREEPLRAPETPSPQVITNGSLNNSGPETFWIPEILITGSGLLFLLSRKRLKKSFINRLS